MLFAPWPNATVNLLGLVTGQVTGNVLPSEEEFYLGGLRYTRGFYSGQFTGDKALAATVELQLNTSLHVEAAGLVQDIGLQFYGFYDWGETWQNQSTDYNSRLRSMGIGLRSALTDDLELDIEAVDRLTLRPSDSAAVEKLVPGAFYFRAVARF
jgi:hemolysin activation/secretion protein